MLRDPEHQIFQALCNYLSTRSFALESVFDGAAEPATDTPAKAEAVVASVDEATVWFQHPATPGRRYGVFLTPGEGPDLICDYTCPPAEKDPQGWTAAMDEFLDWVDANF